MRVMMRAVAVCAVIAGTAQAQPRMDNVTDDLRTAVFGACLPAQAGEADFQDAIAASAKDLGMQDQPMNRMSMKVWRVSKDRRVTLTPSEGACTATVNIADRYAPPSDEIKAVFAEGAVHEQELSLSDGQEGWVFCHRVGEAFIGSVTLIHVVQEERPELGARRPTKVHTYMASVPEASVCQPA